MDHYSKAYNIFSRIRGWRRFQSMIASLRRFSSSEVAQQRLKRKYIDRKEFLD